MAQRSGIKAYTRKAATVAVAAIASATMVIGLAGSAQADTVINHSCGPYADPTWASNPTSVMTKSLPNGGTVELRKGYWPGTGQYLYWTRVVNSTARSLHLDWSDDGGSHYHICNELMYSDSNSAYTYAVNDPGGRVFKSFAFQGNWYGSSSWY